ncbi:hypothetical protein AAFF_G00229670 [Aldrovandia affinis]|uniref:Uncharacterized protein n=1 Tax=Aldrovandia affinis TaxID=143900 RepID=A0AAD7SXC2_9TELE|nr:hypothetical protein AAFF_G00229670 [Aldrovandia affinis]
MVMLPVFVTCAGCVHETPPAFSLKVSVVEAFLTGLKTRALILGHGYDMLRRPPAGGGADTLRSCPTFSEPLQRMPRRGPSARFEKCRPGALGTALKGLRLSLAKERVPPVGCSNLPPFYGRALTASLEG